MIRKLRRVYDLFDVCRDDNGQYSIRVSERDQPLFEAWLRDDDKHYSSDDNQARHLLRDVYFAQRYNQ